MRLEQIEKEADMYNGHGDVYIHVERANGSPMKVITNGDTAAIAQAVYNLTCEVASRMNRPVGDVLKLFKKASKSFGTAKPIYQDTEEERES